MLISELVLKLKDIQDVEGDIPVYMDENYIDEIEHIDTIEDIENGEVVKSSQRVLLR